MCTLSKLIDHRLICHSSGFLKTFINLPRYVDTFEPEEQIDLQEAIRDFRNAMQKETEAMQVLNELLNTLSRND